MNTDDLIAEFRRDADDPVLPGDDDQEDVFWTDTDLLGYIEEGQREIARRAFALRSILNLPITADEPLVKLPAQFLEARDGKLYLQSTNEVVRVRNLQELDQSLDENDYGLSGTANWLTLTGKPRYASLDIETGFFRLIPIPESADTLIVPAYILPRRSVLDTEILEIDNEKYRRAYLLWMKKRAYEKQDSEVFSGRDSEKFFDEFLAEVSNLRSETARTTRRPGVVAYGGL